MEKLTVGIIGAGRIGKLHAQNIVSNLKNVEIKAIADIFAYNIRDWAYSLGINNVYEDYRQILNDSEINTVLICSSTDTHSKMIVESAKAGKNIFCEKPIDFDLDRINMALNTVKEAGVKLQIGFNRRFDHNFMKVHDMIKEGNLGDVHILKITSRDPLPPPIDYIKVSGGLFLDMTIHDFDMARYLIGNEVEEVYVQAGVFTDPAIGEAGDVDTAVISLKFNNGVLGVIDNSRKSIYGYDQRVEVFGSKGCINVSNDTPTNVVISSETGIVMDKPYYFFLERYKEAYILEMRDFVDCIINDKDPSVSGTDGLESVRIGLAAKESVEKGKPVKIKR